MKISKAIELLKEMELEVGDVECLVEVMSDGVPCMYPLDELSYEDRDGYGPSISFLS